MSDYTVDDSMAKIIYELSDREIYNDVRAEIGLQHSDTVIDVDTDYEWRVWKIAGRLYLGGLVGDYSYYFRTFHADAQNAILWKLIDVSAWWADDVNKTYDYYDYQCVIESSDESSCVVKAWNTGFRFCRIHYTIEYKYKTSDRITHDEISYQTLTVRATDDDSITKYGRRVMNLAWPQGASTDEMQMIANAALARYKEPVPTLHVTMQGKTDAVATEIFTREISDTISVICANLGMASTDFFLDKISIRDTATKIPVCTWLLTGQRAEEVTGFFVIDTDFIDGPKLIG